VSSIDRRVRTWVEENLLEDSVALAMICHGASLSEGRPLGGFSRITCRNMATTEQIIHERN